MRAEDAYKRGIVGDLRPLDEVALEGTSAAWNPAFLALRRLAGEDVTLPVSELEASTSTSPEPVAFAVADLGLHAALAFDYVSLVAISEFAERFGFEGRRLPAATVRLWRRLFEGGYDDIVDDTDALAERARSEGQASVALEVSSLRALALLELDRVQEGVQVARRASRMARTESILQREYLANVVLARARRSTQRPYAAARILEALSRVVPPPWRKWLDWERCLAGSREIPKEGPARMLVALLDAAERGGRAAFEDTAGFLGEGVRSIDPLSRDVGSILEGVDPLRPVGRQTAAARWRLGLTTEFPPPLVGIAASNAVRGGREHGAAHVRIGPRIAPRRFLGLAERLLGSDPGVGFDLKNARTFTGLSVLALARDGGLSEADFWKAVYGFKLGPAHRAALHTLVFRMRSQLAERGDVEREAERLTLVMAREATFPDPRCGVSLAERMLQHLGGSSNRPTAREIAAALAVSARTVQRTLGELIEDGLCEAEQQGRHVQYRIEDTTFREPTLSRLRFPGS